MPNPRINPLEPHQTEFLQAIGGVFKQFRLSAGWTQKQAAAHIPTTKARISDLELGKNDIYITTLQRWAAAYGYSMELVFEPIEEEELVEHMEETLDERSG